MVSEHYLLVRKCEEQGWGRCSIHSQYRNTLRAVVDLVTGKLITCCPASEHQATLHHVFSESGICCVPIMMILLCHGLHDVGNRLGGCPNFMEDGAFQRMLRGMNG